MRRHKRLCKDYENIENYEKAKADNFKNWECHHRLETHTSDGERREVDISMDELKALDMYWHRPAEELIFLTISEHNTLHHKGKHISEEHRKKVSEAQKENKHFLGKHHSEEVKKKMSESRKGHPVSKETRKKVSEAQKGNTNVRGTHWFNNGEIDIRAKECPEGFVPGRLKHK